jgi:hypothetical protein
MRAVPPSRRDLGKSDTNIGVRLSKIRKRWDADPHIDAVCGIGAKVETDVVVKPSKIREWRRADPHC